MKITQLLAVSMAAIVGLSACSKDENNLKTGGSNSEPQNLSIYIGQSQTRSVAGSEGGKTAPVTFGDGELFLVDAANQVVDIYSFVTTATNLASKQINITDVTTAPGVIITDVAGSVDKAYIVGNSSSIKAKDATYTTLLSSSSLSINSIKSFTLTPYMQANASGTLANATLWGEGTLIDDPSPSGSANKEKYVKIELRPHVARIELSDIKAVANPKGITITEYNVTGIYVNNYVPTISTDWTTQGTIVNPGQAGTSVYNSVANGGQYANDLAGILFDESASYFGNSTITTALKYPNGSDNSQVWGYNILAAPVISGNPTFATTTTAAPHLIIQVESVKASNGVSYPTFRYITVGTLYKSNGVTPINQIEAGYVYKINPGDLEFHLGNVYTEGETGKFDLRVEAEMIDWTTEPVKPGLN